MEQADLECPSHRLVSFIVTHLVSTYVRVSRQASFALWLPSTYQTLRQGSHSRPSTEIFLGVN